MQKIALAGRILASRPGRLILLSLGLVACATLSDYKRPRIYLTHLQLQEASMLAQTLLLRLRVDNPNNIALPINGIDVELILNGHSLAQGLSNQSLSIPRFGSADVEVEVTTTLISLLHQILSLQNQQKLSYEIAGRLHLPRTLNFGRHDFSFQEKGALDLRGLETPLKKNTLFNAIPSEP